MTLVYILSLELGLINSNQIPKEDFILVEKALKNIGKENLLK